MNSLDAWVKSLLEAGKERIADPKHWCQGAYARDANGQQISEWHEDEAWTENLRWNENATQWCADGAIRAITLIEERRLTSKAYRHARDILDETAFAHGWSSLAYANDNGGHAVVLRIYDSAIKALEGR